MSFNTRSNLLYDVYLTAGNLFARLVWIGVIQLSGSWLWTPLVVALCRRKSTRLTAVLGGLVLALAALFASFAQQLHQVFLRYCAPSRLVICLFFAESSNILGPPFGRNNLSESLLCIAQFINFIFIPRCFSIEFFRYPKRYKQARHEYLLSSNQI